ncbi:hypothetical protein ACFXGT_02200 [Streptomyces sp. NPDC059352]|uniref:hypothetical protein n=1 Tax=Streptomyces sp. NPDC059352 TaxID=3346810 RepID=UPI0036898FD1
MKRTSSRTARGTWLIAALALAAGAVGCQDSDGTGTGSGARPGTPAASSKTPGGTPGEGDGSGKDGGKGKGKESAKPSPDASKKPSPSKKPDGDGSSSALSCDQLRNAELQNSAFRHPDAPEGTIAFTDGRWEGDGVVIELQPQCGIGDVTGDPAADAVAAVKVTTGGTGRFFGLVTWRNDAGTPVPAAAASLGDRTPVVSIDIPSSSPRRATVVYLTRGGDDPAAVVTIRRTAVYRVVEPAMTEVSHSDTPHTPTY